MKKIISGTMSLIMTSALFTQTMPIVANDVDTPVDIDKSIYEQILKFDTDDDINKDGIISEDEFKKIDFIYLNLDNVRDISGLKKAEALRSIDISGGSITDFSVLCGLKNLKRITITSNPVKDISYFKNMDLNYLYLNDTSVSDEDMVSMIQTKDYEIPVGFVENFDLKPSGLLKTQLVIHDDQIAGFGEKGEATRDEEFYNDIIAKKEGETTYSVMYAGKEIAKGKIKVVPSDLKDPVSAPNGIKVNHIESEYQNGHTVLYIITDDNKYYQYENDKFTLIADNVKTAYNFPVLTADKSSADFILKENGDFTIDRKPVFENGTKVSEICGQYAITDDGSLWYILVNHLGVAKTKICSDCEKIVNNRLVSKKDGTVILVACYNLDSKFDKSYIFEVGKMNVVSVYNTDELILDDKGNVWDLNKKNYFTPPDVKLVAENAVSLGAVGINDSVSGAVYGTSDGRVFYCKSGEEIKSVTAADIQPMNLFDGHIVYGGLYDRKDIYTFMNNVTVAGDQIYNDDRIYGRSVLYRNKSLYMSCLGKHMAVTDVKDSYGAVYDKDANDFSIFILRSDNSLWKYCISADTLTQITNDIIKNKEPEVTEPPVTTSETAVTQPPVTTEPEEKFSISDIMSLSQYMLTGIGLTDSQMKKYDINTDGNINIIDVALLKEKLLSMVE